ncbi:MAG: hypothetical protein ACOCZ2_05005 [Thermodesulfobacteriota bacterium]
MSDVFAFDAGIFQWAKAYPETTLLLGEEIEDPQKQKTAYSGKGVSKTVREFCHLYKQGC